LWFVDYLAMRPKFLEEILTFFHVVSAVAGWASSLALISRFILRSIRQITHRLARKGLKCCSFKFGGPVGYIEFID
jgi:hypothetical protein